MSWFKVEREIFNSEVFKDDVFTEREAWIWLISSACFEDTEINVLNNPVVLHRGELSFSIRFMAKKFRWTAGKVQNFLKKLKKWNMIELKTQTGQSHLSICNYSKFQDSTNSQQTEDEQPANTKHTKKKNLRTKELKNISIIKFLTENNISSLPLEWGEWAFGETNWGESKINFEWDKFIDYWKENGKRKKDWKKTWQNWVKNNLEWSKTG